MGGDVVTLSLAEHELVVHGVALTLRVFGAVAAGAVLLALLCSAGPRL
jgi:F0F1-type ATP synthase membrane subunit a